MRAAHEWPLWSTRARICVTEPRLLDEATARTQVWLREVDDAANRFRADSEISTLGERASRAGQVKLSPLLNDLVSASLVAAELTGGAVDPTVGKAMVDLGYDRTLEDITTTTHPPRVVAPAPGWQALSLIDGVLTLPPGTRLDLGATAKAVAADRAAGLVSDALGCGVLVSLGGDIATSGTIPPGGWQITVRDHPEDPTAHIALADGWAVATSSSVQRVWRRGDCTVHHIIDPATGRPASTQWRTVTVAATSCVEANTLATATIVKGARGLSWLADRTVAARLVDQRGAVHLLGGWPQERGAA